MQFGGWCYVCPPDIDERVAETVEEAVKQGKPDWCPLVEIEGDDVAPVVHGHWIKKEINETGEYADICSVCRNGLAYCKLKFIFCPYCGASMDEEDEE
jgi:hypothetical protein